MRKAMKTSHPKLIEHIEKICKSESCLLSAADQVLLFIDEENLVLSEDETVYVLSLICDRMKKTMEE